MHYTMTILNIKEFIMQGQTLSGVNGFCLMYSLGAMMI